MGQRQGVNRCQWLPCTYRECQGGHIGYLILEPDEGWQLWTLKRKRDKQGPKLAVMVDSREKGLPYFDLTWGRDTRLGNEILLGLSDRGPAINLIEPTSSRREWVRKFGYTYFCPDPDADTFTMKCRRCKRSPELRRADLDRRAAA